MLSIKFDCVDFDFLVVLPLVVPAVTSRVIAFSCTLYVQSGLNIKIVFLLYKPTNKIHQVFP
jgi:hypothetical protein